ncbi:hypothetical protein GCM10027579_00970 [Calidifontibacter terrae]
MTVSRTTDGGATWSAGPKAPLRSVTSATTDSSGAVLLSGLGSDCKPAVVSLRNDSAQVTTTTPAWSVDPSQAARLLRAGQPTQPACTSGSVHDLAVDSDQRATVLCDKGVIRRTRDAGANWTTVQTVPGALAIATGSRAQNYPLYAATSASCGVQVTAVADGSGPGCISGSAKQGPADIAVWAHSLWVARGESATVSTVAGSATATSSSAQSSTSSSQPFSTQSSSQSFSQSSTQSSSQSRLAYSSSSRSAASSYSSTRHSTRTRVPSYSPTYTAPAQPTDTAMPTSTESPVSN